MTTAAILAVWSVWSATMVITGIPRKTSFGSITIGFGSFLLALGITFALMATAKN